MIKSKIVAVIALVFIGLNFLSCDSEPVDPALFNTEEPNTCAAPPTFEASDFIAGTSVNLSWSAAAGTGSWQIQYGPAGFAVGSGTQVVSTDTQATINDLDSTNDYEFYIRTVCDATTFSGWVGPISVGGEIGSCAQPTNVVATRSAGNTEITVTWDAGAGTAWQVQYGNEGFALGSGTTVSSTTPTRTITGILANQGYSFYVRTNCSPTSNSNWTGPITAAAVGVTPTPTGDYWPTAIGNQWVYNLNGTEEPPLAIVSTNTIGGFNYYTFTTPTTPNTATTRIRKAAGVYYIKTEEVTHTTPMPGVTSGNEIIILKDNVPVGATWTDSWVQTTTYTGMPPIEMSMSIVCTVEAKDVTATVNGTTYNNVIKVNRVISAGTSTYESAYWFARDIGPIRVVNGPNTQELESYIVN